MLPSYFPHHGVASLFSMLRGSFCSFGTGADTQAVLDGTE